MYNWRLLIFAFFAVFQPIASFAERNLVDGSHQCCDHRLSRDFGSLNGNYPFKLPVEDRRLNYRRDIREVRRDDNRNERTVINGFRDARERQLNGDFDSRVSRIAFQQMSNRVAPRETRETQFRDSEINRDERNFARDGLSRMITITRTDRRDIRNTERHVNRENNQREVLRQMTKDNAQVRRETRPQLRLTADGDRRSYHERSVDSERRVSITRNDVRHQRLTTYRSAESLNRLERDNREYKRSSSTDYRVPDKDIRETRNAAARNDVRISDRIDREQKLSARSLEIRGDNERFYRKTVVARNNEIRNFVRDERRMEGRTIRENIERFEPTRRVVFRRVDSNREKNTERLAPAERSRNISPVRHSRVKNVESIRAATRRTTGEERREGTVRAYRMLTSRSQNRENENSRERTHLMSRNRELQVIRRNSLDDAQRMSNRRTRSLERNYEQRSMRSERENGRAFDQSTLRDKRQERRVINERALSLEREQVITAAQRMERTVTMERRLRERVSNEENRISSLNVDSRDIRNNMSEKSRNIIITRNTESRRVDNRMKSARELTHDQIHKVEQNEFDGNNWQYLMYTMQGIYLCTIFLPMLMDKGATKKKMSLNWGASMQKFIKVD